MSSDKPGVDPGGIMALSTAYWGAQTLLTANRLRLFDLLSGEGKTAAEVAQELALDERATTLLLNACVALELCKSAHGRFSNTAASAMFLQTTSPASLANAIHYSDDLYGTWGDLEQAVRTGTPPKSAQTYLGEDEEQTRHFVYGMHNRAMAIGQALTSIVDLSGRQRMLDVGGGPGTYAALFTAQTDGLSADVLELEGVAKIAEEILVQMGAQQRVTMLPGDYHVTDFGSGYDVVLMSGMFHRETAANCRLLIAKARECLSPNGLLVVNDIFADANGTGPEFAALFGLNMMLTAADGGVHADQDVADWMRDSGFYDIQRQNFPPPMPHRVVIGSRTK